MVDCCASGSKSLKQSPSWKSSGPTPSSGSGPRLAGAAVGVAAAGAASATGCFGAAAQRGHPPDQQTHDDDGGHGGADPRGTLARVPSRRAVRAFSEATFPAPASAAVPATRGTRGDRGRRAPSCPASGRLAGCAVGRAGGGEGPPAGPPAAQQALRTWAAQTVSGARRARTSAGSAVPGGPACRRFRAFRSLRSLRIHHFRASGPWRDARRWDPFPEVHYGTLSKMPGGRACRRGAVRSGGAPVTVRSGRPGEQLPLKACNLGVRQIDQTFRGLTNANGDHLRSEYKRGSRHGARPSKGKSYQAGSGY